MSRIMEVEFKDGKKALFELEWAQNGALKILFGDGDDKGKVFHIVGQEEDAIAFMLNEIGARVAYITGESDQRPVQGGSYVPGFGYIPPCPCGCGENPLDDGFLELL